MNEAKVSPTPAAGWGRGISFHRVGEGGWLQAEGRKTPQVSARCLEKNIKPQWPPKGAYG